MTCRLNKSQSFPGGLDEKPWSHSATHLATGATILHSDTFTDHLNSLMILLAEGI